MEHKILIEFPITMAIENNDDPCVIEGKGWYNDKLLNWKVIMSEKTGTKTWFGVNNYKIKEIILNEMIKGEFLGVAVDNSHNADFISIDDKPSLVIKEKSYLIFKL